MARRIVERSFNPALPVYCRRPFIANGRHYTHGEPFDWRREATNQRRVKQMFDAGHLMHARDDVRQPQSNTTTVATERGPVSVQKPDALDDINDMKELRRIADEEGAPYKVSKVDQRKSIREHRKLEQETRPDGDAPSNEQPSAEE